MDMKLKKEFVCEMIKEGFAYKKIYSAFGK
jgi:hypothetical protein